MSRARSGVMMALVMGVPAGRCDTLDRACDLGIAFQLANIARDVREDDRGRALLPAGRMAGGSSVPIRSSRANRGRRKPKSEQRPSTSLGTSEFCAGWIDENRAALAQLTRRLTDLAAGYEASARIGARRLPFRSRWAVLAASGIYGDIAREVARRGEAALEFAGRLHQQAREAGLGGAGLVERPAITAMRTW